MGTNAALPPQQLSCPRVTTGHIVATGADHAGRAACWGKLCHRPRHLLCLCKRATGQTRPESTELSQMPKISSLRGLRSGSRRAGAEAPGVGGTLEACPHLWLPGPFLHSPPWLLLPGNSSWELLTPTWKAVVLSPFPHDSEGKYPLSQKDEDAAETGGSGWEENCPCIHDGDGTPCQVTHQATGSETAQPP